MQFNPDGTPARSTTKWTWRDDFPWVFAIVLMMIGGFMIFTTITDRPLDSGTADATPVIIVAAGTFPPEIIQAAVAFSKSMEPKPTRTPAPVVPTPTQVPNCHVVQENGVVCQWAPPPGPESTPIPVCDTPVPYEKCMKEGKIDEGYAAVGGTPIPGGLGLDDQ